MDSSILGAEWNLTPEGITIVSESGTLKDRKKILENALNSDLKSIGKPVLATELHKSRLSKIVLQIQKIRNVSAPKAKENSQAAPRMLKITLTDGDSYVQAIEIYTISSISRESTAPGTKVLINDAIIVSGYLLINPQNCKLLGGQVEHLYDKWVVAKSVQQNHQYISNDGAPPWVPFGCKIVSGSDDKTFKSLEKGKDDNTNTEFDQQRKEAIAEASSGAVKKTFGGRVKHNVQPNQNNQLNKGKNKADREDRSKKGKSNQKDDEGFEKFQKPSEKVSLFSFLEDKLPLPEVKNPVKTFTQEVKVQQYKHNISDRNNFAQQGYTSKQQGKQHESNSVNYNKYDTSSHKNVVTNNSVASKADAYNNNRYKGDKSYQQPPKFNKVQNQPPYNSSSNRQQYYNNISQNSTNLQNDIDMHNLATNLSRISVNNEFASRSLKQHLNLMSAPVKRLENHQSNGPYSLKIGDYCMARYWEDGKMYNAVVTAVTDKTYAVQFTGYGNIEEVLKHDCIPVEVQSQQFKNQNNSSSNFSGISGDFRRRGQLKK
ncbi:uncharacterized protein LOC143191463 isoform X1 [Rhynchophorus ferrugineus]|uniref:uncharacterized protein LOC143191463 isoform X1 n=2 Tax=Rhynchophorus ferrugineus TaxID=354439 RepID=UPI003FCD6612